MHVLSGSWLGVRELAETGNGSGTQRVGLLQLVAPDRVMDRCARMLSRSRQDLDVVCQLVFGAGKVEQQRVVKLIDVHGCFRQTES